jgi:hypothetical protein
MTPKRRVTWQGDTRTSGYRERFGTDECWELDVGAKKSSPLAE